MLSLTTLLYVSLVSAAVHERLASLPFGWTESPVIVDEQQSLHLQIALKYSNIDRLESLLRSVSAPGSSGYGHYLDLDQMNAIFGPSNDSTKAVTDWLQAADISGLADGHTISFTTTIQSANRLLDTEFKAYTDGASHVLRTLSYSIPDHLADHIDLISPTTYFGTLKSNAAISRQPAQSESCGVNIPVQISANETVNQTVLGPDCFHKLYNTVGYVPDPNSGSNVAFSNFLNQSASYSDLAQFEKIFNIPSQNFTVLQLINGGVDNQDPSTEMDGEANLDAQNIIGMVQGLPVYTYITGGLPPFVPDLLTPNASTEQNEPYLQYYTYLLSQPNSALPYVISNSYGDHENTVPEKYARRVCNMIGMMGIRGRTILESAGDEGVGAVCLNNEPPHQPQFSPQFPGTCPYVTAVGGTQFLDPEWAWNASSGGFSFYFSQPWYQKDAIDTYLNEYISADTKQYYSSNNYTDFSGRGFPDVSAHSLYPDYLTVINGTAQPNGGTSAASPITAGIFALLNDARFRAGQPAIGFANPWLYEIGSKGLNDITHGGSLGCAGTDLQSGVNITGAGIIPYASWNATVGWDPVTGLGTPNFVELQGLAPSRGGNSSGGWRDI